MIIFGKPSGYKFEFEKLDETLATKEASGFNLNEKNILYEVLINYGIPVNPLEESKEDY